MDGLFSIKRYSDSLFYGHIVLEKILKAVVVLATQKETPYTHNLVELAKLARLGLAEADMNLLAEVNRFNIRARYPDYKLKFYQECTKEYTTKYLMKIKKLYHNLSLRNFKNRASKANS